MTRVAQRKQQAHKYSIRTFEAELTLQNTVRDIGVRCSVPQLDQHVRTKYRLLYLRQGPANSNVHASD